MSVKKSTYIIAEMACSHEGDTALARKIIDGAGKAGADAIQFQIWLADDIMVPYHKTFETLKRIELDRSEWAKLADYVRKRYPKMDIIACVYERKSVDFAEDIEVSAYKLHSADLSNPFLVEYVAAKGKRIDLSVGGSTIEEIRNAVEVIRRSSASEIWIMYGLQNFPTPTDAINLNYMKTLGSLFELPVGYQDHSDGGSNYAFYLPAVAIGMGIDIIEKHITHDRSFKGVDHEAALNPDQFDRFVNMVRESEKALGVGTVRPFSEEEKKYRKYAKKSIVAARDLHDGDMISDKDILYMLTGELGLPPDQASRLIGRKTNKDIKAYQLIDGGDVE